MTHINNMKFPRTTEEQIQKLAVNPHTNQNWLEMVAYENGIDFDHIRQIDDDFCDRSFINKFRRDDEFSNKEY